MWERREAAATTVQVLDGSTCDDNPVCQSVRPQDTQTVRQTDVRKDTNWQIQREKGHFLCL